ncbi:hypothetical protein HUT16_16285 [Kitasatospora sp. NA04385]|uniref:hypothetical protein n=1 Tax=Kitasatospora sp. NA04385 TaxID=2742135 RepID=UPI0015912DE8|nr:hypothetical protein [Kitasatospora sp. NA04385]QKW20419.1 hypothetical protein HUT16_16285 [Kitasatospora sp. NA04385]
MSIDHEELSRALHTLKDRQPPPGPAPVAHLLQAGRRRRRRRNVTSLAGVVAAVAAVAVTASVLLPAGSEKHGQGPAGGGSPSSSASAPPSGSASGPPSPSASPSPSKPVNGQVGEHIRLGAKFTYVYGFEYPSPYRLVSTYDAMSGSVKVGTVFMQVRQSGGVEVAENKVLMHADCAGESFCTIDSRDDGTKVQVEIPPEVKGEVRSGQVFVFRPDGTTLSLTYLSEKVATPSAPSGNGQPLTKDDLIQAALSEDWHDLVVPGHEVGTSTPGGTDTPGGTGTPSGTRSTGATGGAASAGVSGLRT